MSGRVRIDKLLVERGLVESRERAQALLMAGRVFVRGQRIDKPGTTVADDVEIDVRGDACPYVSRGGLKLAGVLDPLEVDPRDRVCADVGASTGGFTDVLLSRGAARVYAVDVGRGQLHQKLRVDPRVRVREGINARFELSGVVDEPASLVTIDVSFISLTLVLPAVVPVLVHSHPSDTTGADPRVVPCIVAMVKPQFELSPSEVGRGGVVRDDVLRARAVERVAVAARSLGLLEAGRCESPIAGPAGNREVFLKLVRAAPAGLSRPSVV